MSLPGFNSECIKGKILCNDNTFCCVCFSSLSVVLLPSLLWLFCSALTLISCHLGICSSSCRASKARLPAANLCSTALRSSGRGTPVSSQASGAHSFSSPRSPRSLSVSLLSSLSLPAISKSSPPGTPPACTPLPGTPAGASPTSLPLKAAVAR